MLVHMALQAPRAGGGGLQEIWPRLQNKVATIRMLLNS